MICRYCHEEIVDAGWSHNRYGLAIHPGMNLCNGREKPYPWRSDDAHYERIAHEPLNALVELAERYADS